MSKRSGVVTMKDVARVAKLSVASVSLALRGHPSIPERTRERVESIARELGYEKRPLLMALTSHRSQLGVEAACRVLAFLTNLQSEKDFLAVPHLRRFLDGFRAQAEAYGYEAKLLAVGGASPEALERALAELGCRAVAVGAWRPCGPSPALDWSRYAVVRVESLHSSPPTQTVCNDQMQTVALAYGRLRELGYRRIGIVTGREDELYTDDLFLAGCLIETVKGGAAADVPPLYFGPVEDYQRQCDRLASWIRLHRVEAVVSNWSGMVERVRARDLEVPRDVAFASLCLQDSSAELAGVDQRHEQVGALAADKLVARLREERLGSDPGATTTYVKGYWRDGASAPELCLS